MEKSIDPLIPIKLKKEVSNKCILPGKRFEKNTMTFTARGVYKLGTAQRTIRKVILEVNIRTQPYRIIAINVIEKKCRTSTTMSNRKNTGIT